MTKRMRFLVVGLLVLIFPLFMVQSEDLPFDRYPSALGFQVGRIAGIGISYQNWEGKIGYQVAAGALYHPSMDDGHDVFNYNIGFEALYGLYADDFAKWLSGRLYAVGGVNHRGYQESVWDNDLGRYVDNGFKPEFGVGAGIGVEAVLFEHFAIATELVYGFFYMPNEPTLRQQFMIEMLPQVSIRYRY